MTTLYRTRVQWTGFPGGPGISTFYGQIDSGLTADLHTMFAALAGYLPTDVDVQVENAGDAIEDTNGDLTGAWSTDSVLTIAGTNGDGYSAPVGAELVWLTSTILDGHRVKGRTFLVPIGSTSFGTDGALNATDQAAILAIAETFIAATVGNLVVWHRPRVAKAATAYHPAVTARSGGHAPVLGTEVPNKAVVLRSRRD